ncbi:pectinesterase family protein [Filimonas effusa]|uniref:Pectinesterase n=1 Tax=Filimonas effusa TaxID=2508721 RepID=A0A4Q1DED3_9BACT|nr:pectinesterase family protein [Filimonas effusa]RXK87265.1 pectin esterase [Filimonas effusa]
MIKWRYSLPVFMMLFLMAFMMPARKKITIWMVGDSTMANKLPKAYPETGWGMAFGAFFDESVTIANRAMNGRSTLSFINEKRWQAVADSLQEGDYVFIEFGHNDEKIDKPGTGVSPAAYGVNLVKFVNETRAKKAIPVLLTPVMRRSFRDGSLYDSHGAYPPVVRRIADSLKVPLIDMHLKSETLINGMGEEGAKQLFNYVDSGHVNYPQGKKDDTHFSPSGAKAMAELAVQGIRELKLELAERLVRKKYDFVVAKDGSGDFTTVQAAINAVPDMRKSETVIFIKNGVYKEKLTLPESKSLVTLIGQQADSVIITNDDFAGKKNILGEPMGTSGSSGFFVWGKDFTARNITFSNSAGPVGQAVAVLVGGDRVRFINCRFLGFQDTLYTYGVNSRQYYLNCYIEGTVDFIFGASTAVFDSCTIHCKKAGYVTAASTPQDKKYGYVFRGCRITGEGTATHYLGRPWRPYAKTVFLDCEMGKPIIAAGWDNWGKKENEQTAFYAEYRSRGEGAARAQRASWSHQLKADDVQAFDHVHVFGDWIDYKNAN